MITLLPKLQWKSLLWVSVRIILLVYIGLGLFLFLFQRSYIYFPQHTNFPVFGECPFFADQEKIDQDGAKFYKIEGSENVIIVYYHGNAGTACDRFETRELLTQTGATLLFVEYPGYGGDDQKTTEETITNTVDHIKNYITENYTEETKIIVIGRSIGTGAAAYHVQQRSVDSLVLISPFTSLPAVAQAHYKFYPASFMMRDRFDNVARLGDFSGDVVVIHGDQDTIIPQKLGSVLYDKLITQHKKFISIAGGDHNNLMDVSEFRKSLRDTVGVFIDRKYLEKEMIVTGEDSSHDN